MSNLSPEAEDVMQRARQQHLLNDDHLQALAQLLSNRLDGELVVALLGGGNREEIVVAIFGLITTASAEPAAQGYLLRLLADLSFADKSVGEVLSRRSLEPRFGCRPATAFLDAMTRNRSDAGIVDPAVYLAGATLRHVAYEEYTNEFKTLFGVMRQAFSQEVLQVAEVAFVVQACAQLAGKKSLRQSLLDEDVVSYLPRLLTDIVSSDAASIIQVLYETLRLAWLLSFEYDGIVRLAQASMIPHLLRVLQRVQKEKCIRLALMTLQNMVNAERTYLRHVQNPGYGWVEPSIRALNRLGTRDDAHGLLSTQRGPGLISEMVGIGVLKTLPPLARRRFGDEDILLLVQQLTDSLEESMETLTSFTEYRGEVLSGSLDWSPVHRSDKFWRENATQMEASDYEVLIALGKLIMETRSDLTLAVACHDLGEIVRYHPTGRTLLTLPAMNGVKERVMSLMSHSSPDISKEALQCTQKIMVQRWEYIQ